MNTYYIIASIIVFRLHFSVIASLLTISHYSGANISVYYFYRQKHRHSFVSLWELVYQLKGPHLRSSGHYPLGVCINDGFSQLYWTFLAPQNVLLVMHTVDHR